MRRLLAWLLSFWPDDPNLDRRPCWEARPVSEPACIRCPRPEKAPNLVPSVLAKGKRSCRTCHNARRPIKAAS